MNLVLIQPPEPSRPVSTIEHSKTTTTLLSPPWNLMCIQTFLLERTRHRCHFVDCRLFTDIEKELCAAVEQVPGPKLLAVSCETNTLGPTSAVLEIAKRHFPDLENVLVGNFPNRHPERALEVPRVDFAICGDPEPVIRNLLDYYDVRARLKHVPGLIYSEKPESKPYWVDSLGELSPAKWENIFWGAYKSPLFGRVFRAQARLSRGHTGLPPDRAFGGVAGPLRFMKLDRFASILQQCAHLEITEVFINDPPGVWTPERLGAWCATLLKERNVQPWSFMMLPTTLDEDTIFELLNARCRRVKFIIPSCDETLLAQYGCVIDPEDFSDTIAALRNSNIQVHLRYWIGGPEEEPNESVRIKALIRKLNYWDFSVAPYPLEFDSPLYEEMGSSSRAPSTEGWIQWARDPWNYPKPVALWQGEEAVDVLNSELRSIQKSMSHSLKQRLTSVLESIRSTNWIRTIENRAAGSIQKPAPPHH